MTAVRHIARKRFGQHFLDDARVVEQIVEAIGPRPQDNMVEIGPGLGVLTRPLLERLQHLHVIELDRDLVARLHEDYPAGGLTVHEGDALRFDFSALPAPLRIVGNLPYNISTPLLFHLAGFSRRCADLHFMLQREVVDRMAASPSTPEYGRLSVMIQYSFSVEWLFDVAPDAFRPRPKVWSAVVRMRPRAPGEIAARDDAVFAQVVMQAFSTRRKTLRNALSKLITAPELLTLGIDPGLRAEALGVESFVAIADHCAQIGMY